MASFLSHSKRKYQPFSRNNAVPGPGEADDYANGGKRLRGSMQVAYGSQLLAQSRTSGGVVVPQCLINVTSIVAKNERQIRALAAKGSRHDLYGPPSSNEGVFAVKKGMIVLHRAKPGASFKTNLASDSGIECLASLNGVSMNTELFMVGVAQTNSTPGDKEANNQATVALHGVQTVVNYGNQRWNAGDHLVADPFPVLVSAQGTKDGPSGPAKPKVYGPAGVPEEQLSIPLRPMGGAHLSQHVWGAKDAIRLRMGLRENVLKLQACKSGAAMLLVLHGICDYIFEHDMQVSPMQPIRGYAIVWAASRLEHMMWIERASIISKVTGKPLAGKEWGNLLCMCLHAWRDAIIQAQDKFTGIHNAYAAALPHGGDREDAHASNQRSRSALHSAYLLGLLDPASTADDTQRSCNLGEAKARITMHSEETLEQMLLRVLNYFAQFSAGIALSSADSARNGDICLGVV
jgi:hypothetical protein